ncbi:syntaxin-5-like [Varroa jacobsoni]|uniref:syntaxin-5-like n=1 Tax=Varroa jacobsoni TaxID=62625 RepID=UPI000BF62FB3|nr:syntaxin-5-like [Varroa jacobsoni]XP_022710083.1 syntaxin-5-like [Varroa jacobsoni]XP_022710084.1 syntaxin-5-like [Varroa jacobsoni]XP_022710085.1 syntaxin-5-like [Varroa jacobsoni]
MLTNRKQNLKTVSSWIPEQFYTYQPLQQLSAQPAEEECRPSVLDRLLDPGDENYTHLLPSNMTFRDRSVEFANAAKQMQSRMGNGVRAGSGLANRRKGIRGLQEYSLFMRASAQIGRDITATFVKLEKLALLAKKKSIFDDRPHEIQELTYIIKQDLSSLNKQIAQLNESGLASGLTGTTGRHLASHSNSVVVSLQSKLASMSNDFKQVLEVRTENLKQQKSRRDQFSSPTSMTAPASTPSLLVADEEAALLRAENTAINMDGGSGWQAVSNVQTQLLLHDEQDSYLQQRADAMQSIESTIVELGGIFQQLAHMVKEQEEIMVRVDSNIENASLSVEAAHSELLKYFQSMTGNRWLMIKVFGVLIVFFILFVVIAT